VESARILALKFKIWWSKFVAAAQVLPLAGYFYTHKNWLLKFYHINFDYYTNIKTGNCNINFVILSIGMISSSACMIIHYALFMTTLILKII
jgi:hypothetical protein